MAFMPSPSAAVRLRKLAFLAPVVLAPLTATCLYAASDANALQKDGERQLEEGRTLLDGVILNSARSAFSQCVQQDAKNAQCLVDLARTEFYLVKVEEIAGQSNASRQMLDTAVSDAQRAVALNDSSAEVHALLADLYGAKITGMMSGMKYGPKANTESQHALQLDPNNAFVYAVLGRKYFYSPSAFGGDINKAIDSFKHASVLDPHSDEDLIWLAKAYRKKGDAAHAQEALAQALRMNPRSVFAQRVQAGKE